MQPIATQIDGPVAVIGDVHGQVDKLEAILGRLEKLPDFEQRWVVFIGDLVDRGPDPKAALDVVVELFRRHPRTTVAAGNHEFAMASALKLVPTPDYSEWSEWWLSDYGAETTFASYGADFGCLDELRQRLPDAHQQLLARLPWCVEHPKYLMVHAGLDPLAPFAMQLRILRQKDFSLNLPPWLCSHAFVEADPPADCPVSVVSGHVRVPAVQFRRKRILIDTTGGVGGNLSCVLLPEKKILSSGDAPARRGAATACQQPWWRRGWFSSAQRAG